MLGIQRGIGRALVAVLAIVQAAAWKVTAAAQSTQVKVNVNAQTTGGGAWYTT